MPIRWQESAQQLKCHLLFLERNFSDYKMLPSCVLPFLFLSLSSCLPPFPPFSTGNGAQASIPGALLWHLGGPAGTRRPLRVCRSPEGPVSGQLCPRVGCSDLEIPELTGLQIRSRWVPLRARAVRRHWGDCSLPATSRLWGVNGRWTAREHTEK